MTAQFTLRRIAQGSGRLNGHMSDRPNDGPEALDDAVATVTRRSEMETTQRHPVASAGDDVADARDAATVPAVSVIVPTRNEAGNVDELVRRIVAACPDTTLEIIFVDDSTDHTPQVIEALRDRHPVDIVLLHRPPEQRTGGLGGAVVAGLRLARAPWTCVMDADLQHPPEVLAELLHEARRSGADLVVASRYCAQGTAATFGALRSLASQSTTVAARAMFPRRLGPVSDPMSGFFLVRREPLALDQLRPRGFKILLEIVARTPGLRIAEVPFEFGSRLAGESKASVREALRFVQLLVELRCGDRALRVARFGLVGVSGLVVNAVVLGFATEVLGFFYLLSAVIATQGSTLWNFGLTEAWVFGRRQSAKGRGHRAAMFFVMNNGALILRGPLLFILTSTFGIHYLISNLLSLAALLALRFGAADRLIWADAARSTAPVHVDPAPILPLGAALDTVPTTAN